MLRTKQPDEKPFNTSSIHLLSGGLVKTKTFEKENEFEGARKSVLPNQPEIVGTDLWHDARAMNEPRNTWRHNRGIRPRMEL